MIYSYLIIFVAVLIGLFLWTGPSLQNIREKEAPDLTPEEAQDFIDRHW